MYLVYYIDVLYTLHEIKKLYSYKLYNQVLFQLRGLIT